MYRKGSIKPRGGGLINFISPRGGLIRERGLSIILNKEAKEEGLNRERGLRFWLGKGGGGLIESGLNRERGFDKAFAVS